MTANLTSSKFRNGFFVSKKSVKIRLNFSSIPKLLETRTKFCFGISGDPATRGRRLFGEKKIILESKGFRYIPNLLQDAELYNKEFLARITTKNASSSSATTKFFEIIPAKKSKLEIGILRLIGYKPVLSFLGLCLMVSSLLSSTQNAFCEEKKAETKAVLSKPASEEKSEIPASKPQLIGSFADIVDDLLPSVVNIATSQDFKTNSTIDENLLSEFPRTPIFDELRRQLDNQLNGAHKKKAISIGSGFIISKDGYIVTNNHVINDSSDIDIGLNDGSKYKAKVVGIDRKSDLALLKINPTKDLKFVKFGDSNKARIGDWAIVIGNPYGFGGSVSVGIISARGRDINNNGQADEYIQTDAAINKGNSGGPVFNSKGEVIGISTAIFSPSGGSVGIGFATPSSAASSVIKQLREQGEVSRGWIGVSIQEITDEMADSLSLTSTKGAFVTDITRNGPAEKAGIVPSDVIVKFEDHPIDEIKELPKLVSKFPVGKTAKVTVSRQGSTKVIKVLVEKLRDDETKKSEIRTSEKKQIKPAGQNLGMSLAEMKSHFKNDKGEVNIEGLLVLDLNSRSEAFSKGIAVGDVILLANQIPVKSTADFKATIDDSVKNGKKLFLLLKRGNNNFAVVLNPK